MWKINIKNIILIIFFVLISFRLFSLQIMDYQYYLEKLSSRNNNLVYEDTSLRGRIYDRNGRLLVDNRLVMTIVYQNDDNMSKMEEISLAYEISPKINLDYSRLTTSYLKDFFLFENDKIVNNRLTEDEIKSFQKHLISNDEYYLLKKNKVTNEDLLKYDERDKKAIYLYYLMHNDYAYNEKIIKEDASIEEFMFFSESSHLLHGFKTKYLYGRKYLYGDTLKGIIGTVGGIKRENRDYYLSRGYDINDKVGLNNLEFIYEEDLRGSKALYLIKNKEKILISEPERGKDITLTIDINIQQMVDDILKREVLNAKKGYNTKYYSHSYVLISDTYGEILSISGKEYLKGKIVDVAIGNITDTVTPGSVVKAASMIVGYDTKAIKIGEVIKDECIKIKDTPQKCSIYTMGMINDINALAYSSNVYQFKTAMRVAKGKYSYNKPLIIDDKAFDIYREYFARFGLGVDTGIELSNESRGYKGNNRSPGLLLNFAIGQYDTYTNIQLNQYISTIARDGKRYQMHLVKKISDEEFLPVVLNDISVPMEYLRRVQEGLKAVIRYGSGKNYTSISSCGKTGTSESFYDSDNDGTIDKETISTNFVMYAPINNPKYAIIISSPNIGLPNSSYKYPINQKVIWEITSRLSSI